MSANDFQEAVAMARNGEKTTARERFRQIVNDDPLNEAAWLWYVHCLDDRTQQIRALQECLNYIPRSGRARRSLETLQRSAAGGEAVITIAVTGQNNGHNQPAARGEPYPRDDPERTMPVRPKPGEPDGSPVFTAPPEGVSPEEVAEREARARRALEYREKAQKGHDPWADLMKTQVVSGTRGHRGQPAGSAPPANHASANPPAATPVRPTAPAERAVPTPQPARRPAPVERRAPDPVVEDEVPAGWVFPRERPLVVRYLPLVLFFIFLVVASVVALYVLAF